MFLLNIIRYLRLVLSKRKFKHLGKNVVLPLKGTFYYQQNMSIADHVYIGPEPYIFARGGISIETNVILAPRVTIHTTNHNYDSDKMLPYDNNSFLAPVKIEKNVWIGSDVIICPGVTIGEGSVVAMGSVVTKDIPKLSIVGGNPAQIIKSRDPEIYKKLDQNEQYYLKLKYDGKINSHYIEKK